MERLVLWHRAVPPPREEPDDATAAAPWVRSVTARLRAGGATILAQIGGSVAAAFELGDAADAVDGALRLLGEAERASAGAARLSVGAAVGVIETTRDAGGGDAVVVGAAIDRAQLLANRARPGEIVVDAAAAELLEATFLFGRQVNAGSGAPGIRASTIDRTHPRRDACRRAVGKLAPLPVPGVAESLSARLRSLGDESETVRVVLRAARGSGATTLLRTAAKDAAPPITFWIGPVPGALEPLGSLRLALGRLWGEPAGIGAAARRVGIVDAGSLAALEAVAHGRAAERGAVVAALVDLFDAVGKDGRPWVVLDPLVDVDPATVECIGEASADGGPPIVLVARLPPGMAVPGPLGAAGKIEEHSIPTLRTRDARDVAQMILGPATDPAISRRVALLGGSTPLGVLEAARTLVAAGDLVVRGDRFEWRVGPRGGFAAVGVESLVKERLAQLGGAPLRVLETVCVCSDGAPESLVDAIASLDGVAAPERSSAIEELREAGFLQTLPWLTPTSSTLRAVVARTIAPARAAELHRLAAKVIGRESKDHDAAFRRATLAHHLAEGGREVEAAAEMLTVARLAADAGFARSAVRLGAAAVRLDGGAEMRASVAELTRALSAPAAPPPPVTDRHDTIPAPPDERAWATYGRASSGRTNGDGSAASRLPSAEGGGDVVKRAVEAILARDFDAVERCAEVAVASGRQRAAADRVRAIAHLARGDVGSAMRILAQARAEADEDPRTTARAALALALTLLHAGQAPQAVRSALGALGSARKLRDPRGEAAAMHVLAACYRALDRGEDAALIEEASPA